VKQQESIFEIQERSRSGKNQIPHTKLMLNDVIQQYCF